MPSGSQGEIKNIKTNQKKSYLSKDDDAKVFLSPKKKQLWQKNKTRKILKKAGRNHVYGDFVKSYELRKFITPNVKRIFRKLYCNLRRKFICSRTPDRLQD